MFWNKQNGNANQNGNNENGTSNGKNGKKTWLHAPDSLVNGHVAYLVKVSDGEISDQIVHFISFFQIQKINVKINYNFHYEWVAQQS